MSDLTPERLAELKRLLDETEGRLSSPRRAGKTHAMREARADARAEVERLTGLVEAARALHQPCTCAMCGDNPSCEMCDSMFYPCATIRALDGEADHD